jgi:mannitol-1-phosphate 5-dehydrogenase
MSASPGRQRTLLLFGAGNIGLSFVAPLFAGAGYRVVIADVEPRVLGRLRRHDFFRVESISPDGSRTITEVSPSGIVDARDRAAIAEVLAAGSEPPIVATAVGSRAFPTVLRTLRDALPDELPMSAIDIVAAENIHDPAGVAQQTLERDLPAVHACAVGKMVPVQDLAGSANQNDEPIEVRAEAFNTLYVDGRRWAGRPPLDVTDLVMVDDIEAWMNRKLYIHNLGHSACAWIARAIDPSLKTISEAVGSPGISEFTDLVMTAGVEVVAAAHPSLFTRDELLIHAKELLHRFSSAALGDTVERVGRDVSRKLARDDRVVGCMLLAARHQPAALPVLADVYATALRFGVAGLAKNENDRQVTASGISPTDAAIRISGLDPGKSAEERAVLDALAVARPNGVAR